MSATQGPVVFVVGSGRSGTTLLQQIFDAHPQLAMIRESYFMPRVIEDWPDLMRDDRLDIGGVLDRVRNRFPNLMLTREEGRIRLEALADPTCQSVIRALAGAYGEQTGKPRWGDKTPRYVLRISLLASTFPEARFIHLVRDGRDVALSYRDYEFGPSTIPVAAYEWKRRVGTGRRAGRGLGPARYTEVRYEDLVEDPERELTRLCDFLDLPYSDEMLTFHERNSEKLPPIVDQPHHAHLRQPVTRGLRDWRTALTRREQRLYEAVAGSLLEDLGYERRFPGVLPLAATEGWIRSRAMAWMVFRQRLRLRTRLRRILRRGSARSPERGRLPQEHDGGTSGREGLE